MDFAHRSDVAARSGSRELRAVNIPASYDAWRPPKRRRKILNVFVETRGKKDDITGDITHRLDAVARQEVQSYALSKFQPSTTLGDPQNVEKTIGKEFDFCGLRNQF